MDKTQTCPSCLWCEAMKRGNINWLECRHDPPKVMGDDCSAMWPIVPAGGWCGEFQGSPRPRSKEATHAGHND